MDDKKRIKDFNDADWEQYHQECFPMWNIEEVKAYRIENNLSWERLWHLSYKTRMQRWQEIWNEETKQWDIDPELADAHLDSTPSTLIPGDKYSQQNEKDNQTISKSTDEDLSIFE